MSEDPAKPKKPGGYGDPPEHSRFKTGNRANPKGRPKQDRSDFAKSAQAVLDRKVPIREGERRRLVTTNEANILSLLAKARRGDARSAERLLELHAKAARDGAGAPMLIEVVNALPGEDLDG